MTKKTIDVISNGVVEPQDIVVEDSVVDIGAIAPARAFQVNGKLISAENPVPVSNSPSAKNAYISSVAASNVSVQILAPEPNRNGSIILNNESADDLYIALGSKPAALQRYSYIVRGNQGNCEIPSEKYVGGIQGVWDVTDNKPNGRCNLTEMVSLSEIPFKVNKLSLVSWFDASDTATITAVSGKASVWKDRSLNRLDATELTPVNQPTTGITKQNNLNVLDFGGFGAISGFSTKSFPVLGNVNIFILAKLSTPSQYGYWFGGNWTTANSISLLNSEDGTKILPNHKNNSNVQAAFVGPLVPVGVWTLMELNVDLETAKVTLYQNTIQVLQFGIVDFVKFASSPWFIGRSPTKTHPFIGSIAEIIALSTTCDIYEKQQVEGYFAHKWAVQNILPVTHPYKTAKP